jgi:phenylacetic acid degradation protein paaN
MISDTIKKTLTEIQLELLNTAKSALRKREFYAAYPEHPKAYAEDGMARAQSWFENVKNNRFNELLHKTDKELISEEKSPYTQEDLGVKYPIFDIDMLISNAYEVQKSWMSASADTRTAILLDVLENIKERFFDIAIATMHTTGQSFMMSFQASGPHANDRALEAIALGHEELTKYPSEAIWEKPMGKFNVKVKKTWKPIGKGLAMVVGCSTFPVWNSVPGIFANLISGNPVIVKPHGGAVLPIAIVAAEIQKGLVEAGFSENICQLGVDTISNPITKTLAEHNDVKIIDYTGGPSFGEYLESLPGKTLFTEKAGINSIILDSSENIDGMFQNIAFAASLYSGQMCTAPQNYFIPETGISTPNGIVSYTEAVEKLTTSLNNIATNPKMAAGTYGAIQSIHTQNRIENVLQIEGNTIIRSNPIENDDFKNARTSSVTLIEVDSNDYITMSHEYFGPIGLVIKTKNTEESVSLASKLAKDKGALSCGAYTTNNETKQLIAEKMEEAYTPVAFNLYGPIWMNQNAAFSDFHVTGGNPAGNASFTDSAFITRRFVWVGHKEEVK